MMKNAMLRRLHIWIACCAILLNALGPAVTHAADAWRGAPLAGEICRAVPVAAGKRTPAGDAKMERHCAYCTPHAGSFALAPPAAAVTLNIAAHLPRPVFFYRSAQPPTAWPAARPRAPPTRV
ncbi:MAG TPA: DUF2946 domain-containing protein [Janthinobacterium sp.]|nr:DUF2946 domain-containing protein [Janthinobacterium sp.]